MKTQLFVLFFLLVSISVFAETFYVSKNGSDANNGSAENPFLTISKAANLMHPGDVCIISEGFYPESVTPTNDGVSFIADEGERVEVSGFNKMDDWQLFKDNIYVAQMDVNLNDQNQLIYNGQMMNLARWPNKTNFNPFDVEAQKVTGTNNAIAFTGIPNLNWKDGGVVWFLGKSRWTSWREEITGSSAGNINFKTLSTNWQYAGSHSPTKGGEFFLQNIFEALDSNGEWFVDRTSKKIYFQTPKGDNPTNGKALVKARTTVFNLKNRSEITIEGLLITGGCVDLESAKNCIVRNCEVIYGNHTIASESAAFVSEGSIKLNDSSSDNLIEENNIQWGAGNGVILKGNGNVVRNNYIGNFNYLGSYACPVELRGKNDLINNEIFNAGRDCVRGGGNGSDCGYNDIHHSNLINDDCGAIYLCCGTYDFTRIHHNWIHNIQSRNNNYESYKATGVYLDNSTKKVIVDHNVMWDLEWACIQINWEGTDLLIYNNTLWSNNAENSKSMGRWVNGYDFKNVQVYNTLANNSEFHYTDIQRTCMVSPVSSPFVNFDEQNFSLKEGTRPIDYGIQISGYTDGFIGDKPDCGAYEFGTDPWIPGPTWELNSSVLSDSLGTGISSLKNPNHHYLDFKIYPNPAQSLIFIDVPNFEKEMKLDIYSMAGIKLLDAQIQSAENKVDIESLSSGLYFVKLRSGNSTVSKPFIVH